MPVITLALYAQRLGGSLRFAFDTVQVDPREEMAPPQAPRLPSEAEGIRAAEPNQIWHLDVTVVRLPDGSKVFLHAVIDDFSRRILAWGLCEKLNPTTVGILREAASEVVEGTPCCSVPPKSRHFLPRELGA